MALIKRLNSDLPNYLEGFFGKDSLDTFWFPRTGLNIPAVNVIENNDGFEIEVAAPGYNKSDFKINLNNNVLKIASEKEEKSDSNKNYTKKEFSYSSFERTFTLPNSVESERIEASYLDGVLKVFIPKREEAKVRAPRSIEIR
jgi:HSP20 family protein